MDKLELILAFKAFTKAAADLSEAWLNYQGEGNEFINKYPFDQSFEDIVHDIKDWSDESISTLK